jgi:hypothetical protein
MTRVKIIWVRHLGETSAALAALANLVAEFRIRARTGDWLTELVDVDSESHA